MISPKLDDGFIVLFFDACFFPFIDDFPKKKISSSHHPPAAPWSPATNWPWPGDGGRNRLPEMVFFFPYLYLCVYVCMYVCIYIYI